MLKNWLKNRFCLTSNLNIHAFCEERLLVPSRGVARLDGARGKKQVWRPHIGTWGLAVANILYWRKDLWHCWDFSAPWELCPFVTPLVPSAVFWCNPYFLWFPRTWLQPLAQSACKVLFPYGNGGQSSEINNLFVKHGCGLKFSWKNYLLKVWYRLASNQHHVIACSSC